MSLGVAFKGPEGIVLAADSRVTLATQVAQPGSSQMMILPVTFDNATKLLRVTGQNYVGAITYGAGAFGVASGTPRTAHSFMPEFEETMTAKGDARLAVEEFAKELSTFFLQQWNLTMSGPSIPGGDMVFIVGGYDAGAAYGRLFEFYIPSRPEPVERSAGTDFGMIWGGQREFTDRLIQGFDSQVPEILQKRFSLTDADRDALSRDLRTALQAKIPFAFLPLQDCVDLTILLLRTTVALQSFLVDVRGVGGAIDVATVTRTEGFTALQQKSVHGQMLG